MSLSRLVEGSGGVPGSKGSNTESLTSLGSQSIKTSYLKDRRKRPRHKSDESGSSGEGQFNRPAPKIAAGKKGRGRLTTTGLYVTQTEAEAEEEESQFGGTSA